MKAKKSGKASGAVEGDEGAFKAALEKRTSDGEPVDAVAAASASSAAGGLQEGDLRLYSMFEYVWHDGNWPVWRQFVVFSAVLVIAPLCALLLMMRVLRWLGVGSLRSDVWAVITSVTVINLVISFYAFKAYQEERIDYEKQHELKADKDAAFKKKLEDRRKARQALESETAAVAGAAAASGDDESPAATDMPSAAASTSTTRRRTDKD